MANQLIHTNSSKIFYYSLIILLLSIHAGLRGETNDLDAFAYYGWYNSISFLSFDGFIDHITDFGLYYNDGINKFETGFSLIGFLISYLGFTATQFIFICAFFSIIVKINLLFRNYQDFWILTLCVLWFLCWQYLLMEMNAVRIAIALSIALLGFKHIAEGSKKAITYILIAALFHISAALLIILLYTSKHPIKNKYNCALILFFSLVVGYMPLNNLVYFLFGGMEKIATYYTGALDGEIFSDFNRFNFLILYKLIIFFTLLNFYHIFKHDSIGRLGFHGLLISLSCNFAFASLPVLAGRLSELFGFFSVLAIGSFLKNKPKPYIYYFFFFLFCLLQFYAIVYYSRLVNFFYFLDIQFLNIELVAPPPV